MGSTCCLYHLNFLNTFHHELQLNLYNNFYLNLRPFRFLLYKVRDDINMVIRHRCGINISRSMLRYLKIRTHIYRSNARYVPRNIQHRRVKRQFLITLIMLLNGTLRRNIVISNNFKRTIPIRRRRILVAIGLGTPTIPTLLRRTLGHFVNNYTRERLARSTFYF